MPASNTRTAGGWGWIFASSIATRLPTTHFSLQVLTNGRRLCRSSKNLKFRNGSLPSASSEAVHRGRACRKGRDAVPPERLDPARDMNVRRRSRVCEVMRPPSRKRGTSLPSLIAARPKVVSAIACARIWQFITVEKAYAGEAALPGYVSTISGPTRRVGRFVGDCPILVDGPTEPADL